MFFTADTKEIIDGKVTDVYFERAIMILRAKGDQSGGKGRVYR
jgi:hypothetical protein